MLPPEKMEQETSLLRSGSGNYSFKSFIAQFLATLASSTMLFSVGMMIAEVQIVILSLLLMNPEFKLNSEILTLIYERQLFGMQPFGCVVGAALQNIVGRKTGMVLTSVSTLTSWVLLRTADSATTLYASSLMMNVSAGLVYAPGLAYIAEITEPRFRGAMTSFANTTLPVGMLLVFYLSSIVDWKTISSLSCCIPIISILMFTFIPDSPFRLAEEDKSVDAIQALRWLRGWTSTEAVKLEFDDIRSYAETSRNSLRKRPKLSVMNFVRKKKSLFFGGPMLKAFGFITLYRFFSNCATLYRAQKDVGFVFQTLAIPIDPMLLPILSNGITILGGLSCCVSIKSARRRTLSLTSILVCSVDAILLGVYTCCKNSVQLPAVPLVLYCALYFFNALGIGSVSWTLISEIFPMRSRSFGIGMSAAMFYVVDSLFAENHPKLERIFGVPACFFLYGFGGLIGFVYLFKCLPETEGQRLDETEKCLLPPANKGRKSSTLWTSILRH